MTSQFIYSLITGIFVSGVAGYLGSLMVTKRMALVGDALGHVALPGMGLALLFGLNISFGAFFFLLLGVLLIWLFGLKSSLPMETLVGIVFVASLAIGFLIIPEHELLEALIGDISRVSFKAAVISVVLAVSIFLLVRRIYPKMILSGISEDLAKTQGIKSGKLNLLYLLSIAAVVALGIKVTGSLLVGALVIVPAATARNLSKNLKQYSLLSMIFGVLSSVFGILIFRFLRLPAGPSIILSSAFFFLISLKGMRNPSTHKLCLWLKGV